MYNLDPINWLSEANEDLRLYRLQRVGRQHMSLQELWEAWIHS